MSHEVKFIIDISKNLDLPPKINPPFPSNPLFSPHPIILKRKLFNWYSSLQLCLGNEENQKGNTNISVGNNLNCHTIHKKMFFMPPQEVYPLVSKSK